MMSSKSLHVRVVFNIIKVFFNNILTPVNVNRIFRINIQISNKAKEPAVFGFIDDAVAVSYDRYSWELKPLSENIELPSEMGIETLDIQDLTLNYLLSIAPQLLALESAWPSSSDYEEEDNVQPEESFSPPPEEEDEFPIPYMTVANVNLRTGPSTETEVITVVDEWSIVYVDEFYNDEWYHASFENQSGFMNANYLIRNNTTGGEPISAVTAPGMNLLWLENLNNYLPPSRDEMFFSNGLAPLEDRRTGGYHKRGYMDKYGSIIVPVEYDFINSDNGFVDGMARVIKGDFTTDGKWGFTNTNGTESVPLVYDSAYDFSEGLAMVLVENGNMYKYGFVNQEGEEVIPIEYDTERMGESDHRVTKSSNGLAIASTSDNVFDIKYGFIDKSGNVVIPLEYDSAADFVDGLAAVEKDGTWGYINTNGEVVIPFNYSLAYSFSDGIAEVQTGVSPNIESFHIDTSGNRLDALDEDRYSLYFYGGLALVNENNKYGFIDASGNVVVPLEFDYISSREFHDNLLPVCNDDKYGYINKSGEIVIPLIYDYAYDFSNGYAVVGIDDSVGDTYYGYIDTNGDVVIPIEYSYAGDFR